MKLFKIIRANEWWYSKLTPLLAIGYATVAISSRSLYKVSPWMFFLLGAMIIGAIFVSVINDISDLEEDLESGKSNRIQKVPASYRWMVPSACLLLGLVVEFFLFPDWLSCVLYLCPWIVFSLYSLPPARLKARGIWGVFADALGSHVFISLLMVSSLSYIMFSPVNWIWFTSTGIWAFCYGLRGILYHQFMDRESDLKVNLNTFARKVEPSAFKSKIRLIISLELITLGIMLYQISLFLPVIALLFYFIVMAIRLKMLGQKIILVLIPANSPFQIFMADYYQTFLPASILITFCFTDHLNIIILLAFILLFPDRLKQIIIDCLRYAKITYI